MKFELILAAVALAANCPGGLKNRKDVDDMTENEWNSFLNAIQKAKSTPHPRDNSKDILEYYAIVHGTEHPNIHGTAEFFYWHRAFVAEVEETIRKEIDGSFVFPYFDSGKNVNNWASSPAVTKTSAIAPGRQIQTEVSQENEKWAFTLDQAVKDKNFEVWSKGCEILHSRIHLNVGGEMQGIHSPRDILFYLHHSYVDYEFAKAQVQLLRNNIDIYRAEILHGDYEHKQSLGFSDKNTVLPSFGASQTCTFKDVKSPEDLCVYYLAKGEKPLTSNATTKAKTTTTSVIATGSSSVSMKNAVTTGVPTTDAGATTTTTATATSNSEPTTSPSPIVYNPALDCDYKIPEEYLHMQGFGKEDLAQVKEICNKAKDQLKAGKVIYQVPDYTPKDHAIFKETAPVKSHSHKKCHHKALAPEPTPSGGAAPAASAVPDNGSYDDILPSGASAVAFNAFIAAIAFAAF